MTKTCTSCKINKDLTNFHINKKTELGYYNKCKECKKEYDKKYSIKNKHNRSKQQSKQRKEMPEKIKIRKHLSYIKNRIKVINNVLKYAKENPGKKNANAAKRHAAKLKRTPVWLTKEQINEIQEFYILAHDLQWLSEEKLEVDHIIPLQGKNVSGLHVPWNLQILPKSLNCSKGNNYE